MIKPGACVIDVGINRITTREGKIKLVGDVDFEGLVFAEIINKFVIKSIHCRCK